jgi:hypothetical protein
VRVFPGRVRAQAAAALLGALAWSWLGAAPVDALRYCAAKASPMIFGIKDLAAPCPDLAQAIDSLGVTPMLFDGWRTQANVYSLLDLANLADTYAGSRPGPSADIAALPAILKALEHERTSVPKSWWDAFWAWLKNWLASHFDVFRWFQRWLDRVGQSATLLNVLFYSAGALVLIAAAAVIMNEWKARGAGRVRRRPAAAAVAANSAAVVPDSEEPDALADKLAALLRMLVSRLMHTRRLETERSLTHRELVARSTFDRESQRAAFAAVAGTAESILYGPRAAAPEDLGKALEEGRVLLAQLSARSSTD